MSATASNWTGAQEGELESEFEQEYESEEEGEGFLGGLGDALGGLLGEGESTTESEFEDEYEGEDEDEGEQFSFGGLFKKIAPILKKVAKVAAPMVGTAILGPAGGALGKLAANALGESEFEDEYEYEMEAESEFEDEAEDEFEVEAEAAHEIASHALTENEALAEMMAEAASHASSEGEAEAMTGAAVATMLSARDRRALSRLLPDLLRGTTVLTRILARRRSTRHAVRTVPTIVRRPIRKLKRQAAAGKKLTRRAVARATASEVRRVLGSPKVARISLARNVRTSRAVKRLRRRGRTHRAVAG
jgi:hypothetical protein